MTKVKTGVIPSHFVEGKECINIVHIIFQFSKKEKTIIWHIFLTWCLHSLCSMSVLGQQQQQLLYSSGSFLAEFVYVYSVLPIILQWSQPDTGTCIVNGIRRSLTQILPSRHPGEFSGIEADLKRLTAWRSCSVRVLQIHSQRSWSASRLILAAQTIYIYFDINCEDQKWLIFTI